MFWPSSPSPNRGSLHSAEERQRARATALYHPMSSPLSKCGSGTQDSPTRENRNKIHMKQAREQLRSQRQVLGRERISERENYARQLAELERQAATLDADPNVLEQTHQEDWDTTNDYEHELEDYLLQQELELEQQLREMQLT